MESDLALSIRQLPGNGSTTFSTEREKRASESEDSFRSSFPVWSSRTRCLLAYLNLVMSFSTVVRFLFSLGLYGSAILIPYVVFRIIVGMPVVLMEIMFGRYVTGPFFKIYSLCPLYLGILICHFLTTALVIFTKFSICVYLLKYMTSLFRGRIVWEHCEKPWSDIKCFQQKDYMASFLKCMQLYNKSFCETLKWETSGRQFWQNSVTNRADSVSFGFSILYLIIVISVVVAVNYKGVISLEKTLTMFLGIPITLTLVLSLITYLTPGSVTGFQRIWSIDTAQLKKPEVWIVGLTDTVRTLNIGLFALSFASSHGKFTDDIFFDVLTIFSSDIFCFALSIPILSMIEAINTSLPLFRDDYDVYVWISEIFAYYSYPNTFWAFTFYLAMAAFELGSQAILCLSFIEATYHLFMEKFVFSYLLILFAITFFVLSIPFMLFPTLILINMAKIILMVICLNLTTFGIFYGIRKFNDDFHFMMGYHPSFLSSCFLLTATLLSFVFSIMSLFVQTPDSMKFDVYVLPVIPVVIYVFAAILQIIRAFKKGDLLQVLMENPDWGPSLSLLKKSRIVFDSKTITKEYMYRKELYKKPLMKPNDFAEQNIVHLI